MVIRYKRENGIGKHFFGYLFLFFSMIPFMFPLPFVKTNMQPYSAILATIVLIFCIQQILSFNRVRTYFLIAGSTVVFAAFVMLFSGVNIESLRGAYNYYAVAVIPVATAIVLKRIGNFPEKLYKFIILMWFGVAIIQLWFSRSFFVPLIGAANWTSVRRGVIGLASEPSFLGIACFYFLHIINYFKTRRTFYFVIVIIMGVLLAQSSMGIVFIAAYVAFFALDKINSKKGFRIWIAIVLAVVVFVVLLNSELRNTRLYRVMSILHTDGISGLIETDVSSGNRFMSIMDGVTQFVDQRFMPGGFGRRIGSGVVGFLCELGIFSIPVVICIGNAMAKTFCKKKAIIGYFFIVIALLTNNTQMGHPMLLTVVGMNLFYADFPDERPQRLEFRSGTTTELCSFKER